jgi:hypothetical protein
MAVQSNTMSPGNVEASMSICQKSRLFSRSLRQGFWPFIGFNIHPNVLHRGASTESELGRSLLHKKVCSKTLSLNNTKKINGNQTIRRQFNFSEFNEASMQNEDFGKEYTIKVLFRDEQR